MALTINNGKSNACKQPNHDESGFGYLALLFLVATMGVTLGVAAQRIDTQLKREKEKELIFIGKQYQQAINSYYHQSPNGLKSLPTSIEQLLADIRFVKPKHHLRKHYLDPVTSQPWVVMTNLQQQITGVHSSSKETFLLHSAAITKLLGEKRLITPTYADLQFKYNPNAAVQDFSSVNPSN